MRQEVRAMAVLAWPVIVAEIGWMVMGLVDTIMVGPLGPAAIGAVGTGSSIFFAVMVFGTGTFLALDTFVAQSYGAGWLTECRAWLQAGLHLAFVLSGALVLVGLAVQQALSFSGIHPEVLVLLQPYLGALLWSVPALLVTSVLRRFLLAVNSVRPVMIAVVVANLVNIAANWLFIYGHLGVPALGAVGSAYATLAARVFLVLSLAWVVRRIGQERGMPGVSLVEWPDVARMVSLSRLGMPAAIQVVLEVGVFAAAAALAGRISPAALAANQVVLNIASFFFMFPSGLGAAAAVRVGQAIGRGDVGAARRAGWSAMGLAAAVAGVVAGILVTAPRPLLGIFTSDPGVIGLGVTLLVICAAFQPFDGLQNVATGALRGIGNTRTPMLLNLAAHWGVGLPVAYLLCFTLGWGVIGLWVGLSLSLMIIGVGLVITWARASSAPEGLLVRPPA